MTEIKTRKKLIEVALPLDAINSAAILEKQPFTRNHPRSFHVWWARRPLTTARALLFAQFVDDPSEHPEIFPTQREQNKERERLFDLIQEFIEWNKSADENVIKKIQQEIWKSWRLMCDDNRDHPESSQLFNPNKLPAFHDPFAGGGSLPLEAQRLGLESYGSDLNPVAVIINKAMVEIPSMLAGAPPVNPASSNEESAFGESWKGMRGLIEDVPYYAQWIQDQAIKKTGHLFPDIEITAEMAKERPDLAKYVGFKAKMVASLWTRTVQCMNPGCLKDTPLLSTFILSKKRGKEFYLIPKVENKKISFQVSSQPPKGGMDIAKGFKRGTSAIFECAFCGTVTSRDYVAKQATSKGLGLKQTAIVVEGDKERIYLDPSVSNIPSVDMSAIDTDFPELDMQFSANPRDVWCRNFGLNTPRNLFTDRQLVVISEVIRLIESLPNRIRTDASNTVNPKYKHNDIESYVEAISLYLSIALSRWTDLYNTLCTWNTTNGNVRALFSRQAMPMTWDFVELSFSAASGSFLSVAKSIAGGMVNLRPDKTGIAIQLDAATQNLSKDKIISTDPPYYDNITYSDLSDFFYVWLRKCLRKTYPELFETVATPKSEELVATTYRHKNKKDAESFFLTGMTKTFEKLAQLSHGGFPITIYYAYKQFEKRDDSGIASTGWETFLQALITAGLVLTGTWPVRTERTSRSVSLGTNALASSLILVCRRRPVDSPSTTRREFISTLKIELPRAIKWFQRANIAPVDMAQAVIGPGMAIYTRYAKVIDASGEPVPVGDALQMIQQTLNEVLNKEDNDYDPDTRWALAWFDETGFSEGEYGRAEQLSLSMNISVEGMVTAGILLSGQGKVRLLRPDELPEDWDPSTDTRNPAWESMHQLVRALEAGGENAAATLLSKFRPGDSEATHDLAYKLYNICERKNRAAEALSYNTLVQSWPEIERLARLEAPAQQGTLI